MKSLTLPSIFAFFSLFIVEIVGLISLNNFILRVLILSIIVTTFIIFRKNIAFYVRQISITTKYCNKKRLKKKVIKYLRENKDFVYTGKSLSKTFYFSNYLKLLLIIIFIALFKYVPLMFNSKISVYMFFFMMTLSIILYSAFNMRKLIIISIGCILFTLSPYILFLSTQDPVILEMAKFTFAYTGLDIISTLPFYILVSILIRETSNIIFKLSKNRLIK